MELMDTKDPGLGRMVREGTREIDTWTEKQWTRISQQGWEEYFL